MDDAKTSSPPAPPENPWSKFKEVKYSRELEDDQYKIFELTIRWKNTPIPSASIIRYFESKVPGALESIVPRSGTQASAFFMAKEPRDMFHLSTDRINSTEVKFESYPPPKVDAPHWKEPPQFTSTRMRLLKIPMRLPLETYEAALKERFPDVYVINSATFETLSECRRLRNGNLTFFVKGIKTGTPFRYLSIRDYDILLENPGSPNPPNTVIPMSSRLPFAPIAKQSENPLPPQPKASAPKETTAPIASLQNPQTPKPSGAMPPPAPKEKKKNRRKTEELDTDPPGSDSEFEPVQTRSSKRKAQEKSPTSQGEREEKIKQLKSDEESQQSQQSQQPRNQRNSRRNDRSSSPSPSTSSKPNPRQQPKMNEYFVSNHSNSWGLPKDD